jgi:hypothetical protein
VSDLGVPHRVEPDVRVEPALEAQRPRAVEHVERRSAPSLERILDGGLEPVTDVQDEGGLLHAPDVPRRQLEIVWLCPGGVRSSTRTSLPATCSAA